MKIKEAEARGDYDLVRSLQMELKEIISSS